MPFDPRIPLSAFPHRQFWAGEQTNEANLIQESAGMTLLDWFAGQTMQLVLLNPGVIENLRVVSQGSRLSDEEPKSFGRIASEFCYSIAEEMVEERTRRHSSSPEK